VGLKPVFPKHPLAKNNGFQGYHGFHETLMGNFWVYLEERLG